jgi:hypothetical protein
MLARRPNVTDAKKPDEPQPRFQHYPTALFHPGFIDLGHQFPAEDAHVLRWLAGIASKNRPDAVFAEIGSFVGTSALILSEFAPIFCYDTWAGSDDPDDPINELFEKHDVKRVFNRNVVFAGRFNRVRAVQVSSHFGEYKCSRDEHEPVDLFFIDGDHREESVARDIANASLAVKSGGILCGHDYGIFPGVTAAVNKIKPDGVKNTVWWKFM